MLWLGTHMQKNHWENIMQQRVRRMIAGGIIKETKKLIRQKISKKRIREFGFEYAHVLNYLEHDGEWAHLYGKIIADTRGYRHRQMTWFKKNHAIVWIRNKKEAERLVRNFLKTRKRPTKIS